MIGLKHVQVRKHLHIMLIKHDGENAVSTFQLSSKCSLLFVVGINCLNMFGLVIVGLDNLSCEISCVA